MPRRRPMRLHPAIVVTGFRRSLEAALNLKKNSVAAVDAIVAEDIAKFPDQNLARSLQRIPAFRLCATAVKAARLRFAACHRNLPASG
jgi:hypothetical protein